MSGPLPWRLVEWWLRRRLPAIAAGPVLGDLREDYDRRRQSAPLLASLRWLISESRSLATSYRSGARQSLWSVLSASGGEWRTAARGLRRRPGFALAAIATLTIGLGAAAASWSIFDALLLRPLDYPQSDRLLYLSVHLPGEAEPGASLSFQETRDIASRVSSLEGVAAFWDTNSLQSMTPSGPVGLRANFVQGGYLSLLGAQPLLGRLLSADDDRAPGQHPVVVVSEAFWRNRLDATASVVGSALTLNNRPFTVVGVVSAAFRDVPFEGAGDGSTGLPTDVWVPSMMIETGFSAAAATGRGVRLGNAIGRLAPGSTVQQVRDQLASVAAQLDTEFPETNRRIAFWADPLDEWIFRRVRQSLEVVVAASLALLLVGALNVGGLLLVRQQARAREMSVRRALGATRAQLIGVVAIESVWLAVISGLLAAPVAAGVLGLVRHTAPLEFPRLQLATFDLRLACVLVALALGAALAISIMAMPTVLRASETKPGATRSMTADRRTVQVQRGVVVAEIALAAMMLVCGSLVLMSVVRLDASAVGFDTDRLATIRLSLRSDRYREDAAVTRFAQRVMEEARAIPATSAVTLWGPGRPGRSTWIMYPVLEQNAGTPDPDRIMVWRHNVSPGALAVVGVPVIQGREFRATDVEARPYVVVVSESMARKFWPGKNPIGQRFTSTAPAATRPWFEVIGVAADAAHRGRLATLDTPNFDFYQLLDQRVDRSLTLVMRLNGPLDTAVAGARAAIGRVDPELALQDIRTMDQHLDAESKGLRFASWLLASFAGIAFLLSVCGIYALVAYLVSLRSRELALRQALGATVARLIRGQLSGGLALAVTGVALGLAIAWSLSSLLAAVLFGVHPRAPMPYAATAVVVMALALVATAVPSRRVRKISPATALQSE